MGVIVRQTQSEQQGIRAEDGFEFIYNGDGATFAHEDRLAVKRLAQCAQCRLGLGAVG